MFAAVLERHRKVLRCAGQQQRTAFERETRHRSCLACDEDRSGQHVCAAVCAGVPADQQQAAPHAFSGTITGMTVDRQNSTAHALPVSIQRATGEFAGIAVNLDQSCFHPASGKGTGIAVDDQAPTVQTQTRVRAAVALDGDRAGAHGGTDMRQAVATIVNGQVLRIPSIHIEYISDTETIAQLQRADCGFVQPRQPLGRQRG